MWDGEVNTKGESRLGNAGDRTVLDVGRGRCLKKERGICVGEERGERECPDSGGNMGRGRPIPDVLLSFLNGANPCLIAR